MTNTNSRKLINKTFLNWFKEFCKKKYYSFRLYKLIWSRKIIILILILNLFLILDLLIEIEFFVLAIDSINSIILVIIMKKKNNNKHNGKNNENYEDLVEKD